jgi:hypothetical protein
MNQTVDSAEFGGNSLGGRLNRSRIAQVNDGGEESLTR